MTALNIRGSEMMQTITLRVSGLGVLRGRLWLAAQIFKLGAFVAGCGVEIASKDDE